VAHSLIRPKSQIPNIRHDGTLLIENSMLMMKKPKDLEFELEHPKNVLLASVVHGISCLLWIFSVVGLPGRSSKLNQTLFQICFIARQNFENLALESAKLASVSIFFEHFSFWNQSMILSSTKPVGSETEWATICFLSVICGYPHLKQLFRRHKKQFSGLFLELNHK
jgi:hypothetical protein